MVKLERSKKVMRKFLAPVPTKLGGLGLMLKVLPKFLRKPKGAVPQGMLGRFKTDRLVYEREPESGLRVTWFGHSSMLVEINGVRVLIDPVWDERASPVGWAGPRRFFPPTLELEELPRVDAVLISHDHYDHLGEKTVRALALQRPEMQWVTSLGVGAILHRFGVRSERIVEMDWLDEVMVRGVGGEELQILAVPTRHFSGRSTGNRNETLWGSFVLSGGAHRVYYGADSGMWEGFAAIGAAYGPFDLTMLEVGASDELWKDIHLGPDGAAQAFEDLGGEGLLMPIHWGLFDLALHGWRQPIERILEVAEAKGLRLWSPEPGLPTDVMRGVEVRSEWWR